MLRVMGVALMALTALAMGMATGVPRAEAETREVKATAPPAAFTLGMVQKALRPGMPQTDVAERLGSPNILTRDAQGREAWVYDRICSEVEVSAGGIAVGGLGSGAGNTFAGLVGISAGKRSEKARTSQRTLTVVVRFSSAGAVESFTWHDSRF